MLEPSPRAAKNATRLARFINHELELIAIAPVGELSDALRSFGTC